MGEYAANAQRMRKLICDTMRGLLLEKPFQKIVVRDVLERAHIQRATFYHYFRDKYQVVETINGKIAEMVVQLHFSMIQGKSREELERMAEPLQEWHAAFVTLIDLYVESVHLLADIHRLYADTYQSNYPDADEYECFLAAENFVAAFVWNARHGIVNELAGETFLSEAQTRIVARRNNILPEQLVKYVHSPNGK